MRQVTRPLLVLHPDVHFREQVRKAGGKRFDYLLVEEWDDLHDLVRSSPPAALIVVDPYESAASELSASLRALLLEFPSATVIAAFELRPDRYRDLRTLGAWGVADIIVRGEDDTTDAIARRLRAIQGRPLQSLLERSLPANTSGQARALLMAAAEVTSTGGPYAYAEVAFGPLGIGGSRYITMSWRGRGTWQGRGVTITVMAGQRRSPASMFVELVAGSRFDLSVGPPVGSAGRWLRGKLSSGVDITSPHLPGLSLYTNDPSRGTTTADGAAANIRRIMTPQTPGQQRYVFVRAGVVKLHVIGDAWQALTAQSARADLDDLVAIAHAAERY